MMINILDEKEISFKELEQKIFQYVCELGCEITKMILERYDDELSGKRDKEKYRDKGKRKTSIKTVYGPVEYKRRVYKTKTDDGEKAGNESIYDGMRKKKDRSEAHWWEKEYWQEWKKSGEFHEKREAFIRSQYNVDEIGQRILNGDGGSWIKEEYDPDTIFQLDRYHIYQEILRKISDKKAQKDIRELLEEDKPEEMLEYIKTYATSVESPDEEDKKSKKAMELYKYLDNNRDGLLPYNKRGIKIPEPDEGIIYKGMGVQENQNCTTITLRMKHRRMRWSKEGANNLAKALYKRENRELIETIDRYTDGMVFAMQMQEIVETISAAKAPKKDGKGNTYADIMNGNVPITGAVQTEARKIFKRVFC